MNDCETAAILDAILDFGPLECEEKLAPYFFKKTYNIFFFQNQLSFCFYQKNDTKSQMSLMGSGNIVRRSVRNMQLDTVPTVSAQKQQSRSASQV